MTIKANNLVKKAHSVLEGKTIKAVQVLPTRFLDYQMESSDMIELLLRLEQKFGLDFKQELKEFWRNKHKR